MWNQNQCIGESTEELQTGEINIEQHILIIIKVHSLDYA